MDEQHQDSISFAADILPKFRKEDIDCMKPSGIRLGNPDWMMDPGGDERYPDYANARTVFAALETGRMPPDAPWPQGWLATYATWMGAGFPP